MTKTPAELYAENLTMRQIARTLGRSYNSIRDELHRQGVAIRPSPVGLPRRFSSDDIDKMVGFYRDSGQGTSEIGRQFGCDDKTVWYHLRRRGVVCRPRGRFSKLPVDAMAQEYLSGATLEEVAQHFLCGPSSVARAFNRAAFPRRRGGPRAASHCPETLEAPTIVVSSASSR